MSPARKGSNVEVAYTGRPTTAPLPKDALPSDGLDAETTYRLIHDELLLDGSSRLNLATFVTTWMEPQADRLMAECYDKNMIDKDEYPQTAEIERRCVNMVADLFHSPGIPVGASTIGSSEAVMLAGLAMLWNWRTRTGHGAFDAQRPNLILGSNVQVVWEKFCKYWDVEPRYLPMARGRYCITPEQVVENLDENTIGVVAILGTTFTGEFEPIGPIHDAIAEYNEKNRTATPLHIDAASGGFVAPFLHPHLEWDFRLPWVKSINVSGHKYGLTYPGVGFVVWRAPEDLPEDLVFHVNYLGGDMPTFTLNFSRPGNQIVGQYFNFIHLGHDGYRTIMETLRDVATDLSGAIAEFDEFELISDGSQMPVFAVQCKDGTPFDVFDVSDHLRRDGWQVPAYTMPKGAEDVAVLRFVIREGFTADLAFLLLASLRKTVDALNAGTAGSVDKTSHFSHT
jgi:glutamate decarboxylase